MGLWSLRVKNILKEGNSDTCYNLDEPWRHSAKWNKLCDYKKINTVGSYLYEVLWLVKNIETESRMVISRCWREEKGELLLTRYRVSDLQELTEWVMMMAVQYECT